MATTFERQLDLPVSAEKGLAWHERPGALDRLIPPWENVSVLKRGDGIREGSTVTVAIRKSDRVSAGYCLTTELLVAEPREQVFEFFADAFQLETITPPWLHFSVRTPRPLEMEAGTMIDYKLRLHTLPVRWRSQISEWQPPFRFVDEQVQGPYRYWHHLHTFEENESGTLVGDIVHYAVPLGFILHPLLVRPDLTKIFEYRREMMSRVFTPVIDNSTIDTAIL